MDISPQTAWEFAALSNIVRQLLEKLLSDFNPKLLSFAWCALMENCKELRRDQIIHDAVNALAQTIAKARGGNANIEQLKIAAERLQQALDSREHVWSFRALIAS